MSKLLKEISKLKMNNKLNVFVKGNQLYTDSREVAEMVGKRHDHLVRDIDGYVAVISQTPKLGADEFFVKSGYKAGTGKNYPCYLITKKGCEFVANKLTGQKGIIFTAEYINAFHYMENKLKEKTDDKLALPKDYPSALRALADEYEKNQKLTNENAEQKQLIAEQKPKVNYYDIILRSKNAITITQIAKDYGKTAQWLNEFLHNHKIQYKQGNTWLLYKNYAMQGYTKSETVPYTDHYGEQCSTIHTKWTQKGRLFIYDLLKRNGVLPLIDIKNSNGFN